MKQRNKPNAGAQYLQPDLYRTGRASRSPFTILALSAVALFMIAMAAPAIHSVGNKPNAEAFNWGMRVFCSDELGTNMDVRKSWTGATVGQGDFPAGDANGRRLTAQEAFGWSVLFVGYQGETDPEENDGLTVEEDRADNKSVDVVKDNEDGESGAVAKERVYDERTWNTCVLGSSLTQLANGGMLMTQTVSALFSSFTTFAFNTNIVCENAGQANQGSCIDLLFIVGGDGTGGDTGGLIGALTDSIYMPLIVLVAVLVGIWTFWQGIVQRKLREALWGVIWACVAVVLGLAFLFNPAMLAKAPATVSNTLAGCVISAFGGDNCTGGSPSNPNQNMDSDEICTASAGSAAPSDRMQLISASLNCSIWKAFVLEPYAQASFGTNYTNLGTGTGDGQTRGKELVAQAGRNNNEYCVNLQSSRSLNSMAGETLQLDGGHRVCNIALYQLYLLTDAASSTDGGYQGMDSGAVEVDERWYRIVDVASTNEATWSTWSSGGQSSMAKTGTAAIALLTAVLGGFVIATIAVFAVLFYLSSIFLMALAPLFFLIGVHPGKGRDVLKGYGGMVLSSVFKYLASALFLIVSLALYGGVLGASTSLGMTLLMVLVLSLALFMYRREIVDLIGTVNMGGQQFGQAASQKFGQKFGMNKNSDLSRLGMTAAGSAIGGALATGGARPTQWGAGLKGSMAGVGEGVSREMKREGGLLGGLGAGVATSRDTVARSNDKALAEDKKDFALNAKTAQAEALQADRTFDKDAKALNDEARSISKLSEEIDELVKRVAATDNRQQVLDRMEKQGGYPARFAEAMKIQVQVASVDRAIATANANGEDTTKLAEQRADLVGRRDTIRDELAAADQFDALRSRYEKETAAFTKATQQLTEKISQREASLQRAAQLEDKALASRDAAVEADTKARAATAKKDAVDQAHGAVRPGRAVTAGVVRNVMNAGEEAEAEAQSPELRAVARDSRTADLSTIPTVQPVEPIAVTPAIPDAVEDAPAPTSRLPKAPTTPVAKVKPVLDATDAQVQLPEPASKPASKPARPEPAPPLSQGEEKVEQGKPKDKTKPDPVQTYAEQADGVREDLQHARMQEQQPEDEVQLPSLAAQDEVEEAS